MNKLFLLALIIGITGCAPEYTPNTLPPVKASLMVEPCKFSDAKTDADEDLSADVQSMDCGRKLRQQVYELQDWIKNVTE
ncbi:lysis protein [Salmonella phage PhiSTP1]|nr:lysis protein [Salmonella phage PhiSTP1]